MTPSFVVGLLLGLVILHLLMKATDELYRMPKWRTKRTDQGYGEVYAGEVYAATARSTRSPSSCWWWCWRSSCSGGRDAQLPPARLPGRPRCQRPGHAPPVPGGPLHVRVRPVMEAVEERPRVGACQRGCTVSAVRRKRTTGRCCHVHRKGRCRLRRNHAGEHVYARDPAGQQDSQPAS